MRLRGALLTPIAGADRGSWRSGRTCVFPSSLSALANADLPPVLRKREGQCPRYQKKRLRGRPLPPAALRIPRSVFPSDRVAHRRLCTPAEAAPSL